MFKVKDHCDDPACTKRVIAIELEAGDFEFDAELLIKLPTGEAYEFLVEERQATRLVDAMNACLDKSNVKLS